MNPLILHFCTIHLHVHKMHSYIKNNIKKQPVALSYAKVSFTMTD